MRNRRASFEDFIQKMNLQREICTIAVNHSMEKQEKVREVCSVLIAKWNQEEQRREDSKNLGKAVDSGAMDVGQIRHTLRGAVLMVKVESAVGLGGGGLLDKIDPYLVIKLVNAQQVIKSPVYEDAGNNPYFDFECRFRYNGESAIEFNIFDKDRFTKDELLGVTTLSIEQFHDGFIGALDVKRPATIARNAGSGGSLQLAIEWADIKGGE